MIRTIFRDDRSLLSSDDLNELATTIRESATTYRRVGLTSEAASAEEMAKWYEREAQKRLTAESRPPLGRIGRTPAGHI